MAGTALFRANGNDGGGSGNGGQGQQHFADPGAHFVDGGPDKFIRDGDNTCGGKVVTNPSGGLLSKGHPLGATGLAQCFELTHQLRGSAGARQVEGARVALQHNLGLGGARVVTMFRSA
jgi:sterol carrier protein 2